MLFEINGKFNVVLFTDFISLFHRVFLSTGKIQLNCV